MFERNSNSEGPLNVGDINWMGLGKTPRCGCLVVFRPLRGRRATKNHKQTLGNHKTSKTLNCGVFPSPIHSIFGECHCHGTFNGPRTRDVGGHEGFPRSSHGEPVLGECLGRTLRVVRQLAVPGAAQHLLPLQVRTAEISLIS
jgi:hypothetical protein